MAVVSISSQCGAGGRRVGEIVASRLGCRILVRENLYQCPQRSENKDIGNPHVSNMTPSNLAVQRICNWIISNPILRDQPSPSYQTDQAGKHGFLSQVILDSAFQDNVVFIEMGSQYVVQSLPFAVCVLLVATEDDRINYFMQKMSVSLRRAKRLVRREEEKRLYFLRSFRGLDPYHPELYHLTLNTSLMSQVQVADFICRLAACKEYACA